MIFALERWRQEKRVGTLRAQRSGVDRVKEDTEGQYTVRCILVAWEFFKARHEDPRDELYATIPPLEANTMLESKESGENEEKARYKPCSWTPINHTSVPTATRKSRWSYHAHVIDSGDTLG